MMPDLGKYAVWVLSAYGVSLTLLAAIVAVSILQAGRTLRDLRRMEEARERQAASVAEPPAPVEEPANG